ncbi:hypothetical protein [Lapillicoccus jejuensis]|uniref:Uncharacterized protein n=1 Tax=Lapillicoccus jejuensis TaxID=402171 RepID=A0A542DX52_9MICO|nr:hypothetical protein [Lapillicoccus jejuensis]TQJ07658.1 hypothetical protein FB458_0726 [Lapillicoccus jejuensis]
MTTSPTPAADDAGRARAAAEVLAAADRARRTARADRQGLAIPLLVTGVLVLGYGVLVLAHERWIAGLLAASPTGSIALTPDPWSVVLDGYWSLGGALALAVTGAWLGLRARRVGVGETGAAWATGVLALVLFGYALAGFFLPIPLAVVTMLSPAAPYCLALLVVAAKRHDRALAVWALVVGLLVTLDRLGWLANRVYDVYRLVGVPAEQITWWVAPGFFDVVTGVVVVLVAALRMRADRREAARQHAVGPVVA